MNIHQVDGTLYQEKISRKFLNWISEKFENGEVPQTEEETSLFIKDTIPELNEFIKNELNDDEQQVLVNDHLMMADTRDLTIPKGYDYFKQLVEYAVETEED